MDWRRLKAVVLESDDWGLCAWVPDDQAHRALAVLPAFRSPAGLRYGRSTLESADDVSALAGTLLDWRGGDGFPPVLQANTIVANPDYDALSPPLFEGDELPVLEQPRVPARWNRPGLWDAVRDAESAGVWWAELHGLHHLPAQAWLTALRRGQHDARRAFEQQSPIGEAVEASGEYGGAESQELRARDIRRAIDAFRRLFGRAPTSFCPPDYHSDDWFEAEAASLGLTTWQGKAEQAGRWLPWLRRRTYGARFPHREGERFLMPPRVAFEPSGDASAPGRRGLEAAHRAARAAWERAQPAVVSTHRMNYAHLDADWSAAGRGALSTLLQRLCADGAIFLTDHEVRQLAERSWSVRELAGRGVLLRHYGAAGEPLRFAAPGHVSGAVLRGPRHGDEAEFQIRDGQMEVRSPLGEYVIEWTHA
jgi:peptidoglycan/xylan/chitin deacetylase (PgdA/CDA1 family)